MRGELDVAFCGLPVDDERLERVDVLDDPVVAFVAAGAPPAALDRPAQPADLAGQRLVRLTSWAGQDAALRWLGRRRAAPPHVTDREATLRSLVAAGEACAIVPRLVATGPGTAAVALQRRRRRRAGSGSCWSAERSGVAAIAAFVADVRRAAASHRS